MKRVKIYILFYLIGFLPLLSIFTLMSAPNGLSAVAFHLNNESGVTNYKSPQNVTYKVETSMEFELQSSETVEFCFKNARFDNRTYNSPLTPNTPPYQISSLKSLNIDGNATPLETQQGEYNNTYDLFNATLSPVEGGTRITLNYEYEITLNEIQFENISDDDIGSYNQSSKNFELYCNKSVEFFEKDNSDLKTLSNSIVNANDNPIEKAEDIFNWITENIDYEELNDEQGALYAYDNKKGDCSEFSDLMITLLRIQGIPARKVTGLLLTRNPLAEIEDEQEWNYDQSYDSSNDTVSSENPYLGHAWLEYYVPQIGWIACDPTWGVQKELEYFNRIDYLRFATTQGAWISTPFENYSEYPYLPLPGYSPGEFDYSVDTKITVVEANLSPSNKDPELWMIILTGILVGIIIAAIVGTVYFIIKKVYKKDDSREFQAETYQI
ncbi:MAG: transglutaminase-like domain-containing protein [Promethearchaeia archaeon]